MNETGVIKVNYTLDLHKECIKNSLVAPHLTSDYKFSGAKGIIIEEPQTVPMVDYRRSGSERFGAPQEAKYYAQELLMNEDKSFAITIDKGTQREKSPEVYAAQFMQKQIIEQAIPLQDKHSLEVLSEKAGTIEGNSKELTSDNIAVQIMKAGVVLNNAEIPSEERVLFVSANSYMLLKMAKEFLSVEQIAKKSLEKGVIGYIDNMKVVQVPSSRWPKNVNFIIVHKSSATAPSKINDAKLFTDAPGISGSLLQGRNYFDCFVIGNKCKGVYAEVDTGTGKGTIVVAPVIADATGKITTTTAGAVLKWTDDGSDPRYSKSAKDGDGPATNPATGTVIKACAFKSGMFPSAVSEKTIK